MCRFTAVAGAQQRDVFIVQPELLRPARFDKWQGLQRLERGARKGQPMRVARMGQQLALRVDDGHRANVLALQRAVAGEFDEGDVVHGGNCGGF